MTPEIERTTDPDFVAGLSLLPLSEIRDRRREAQAIENALSYVRRMVQGRLDIVGAELQRRRAGGDPGDLSELIGRLPDILADAPRTPVGVARPPLELEPDRQVTEALEARLDAIFEADQIGSLADQDETGLLALTERLADFEHDLSATRRALHDVIAALQAEVTRRYRTGEASVDSLLS